MLRPLQMTQRRRPLLPPPLPVLRLLPVLKKRNFALAGDEWKKMKPPEGLPEVLRPWYLKKHVYAERQGTSLAWIHSPDIVKRVMDDYTALSPLYWIFRGCVEEAMNQMDDRLDEQGGKI